MGSDLGDFVAEGVRNQEGVPFQGSQYLRDKGFGDEWQAGCVSSIRHALTGRVGSCKLALFAEDRNRVRGYQNATKIVADLAGPDRYNAIRYMRDARGPGLR